MTRADRGGLASVRLAFRGRLLTQHAGAGGFVIGREAPADVRIDHPASSRLHATVWPGRCWKLIDFDSRNGIFVGGVRVRGEVDIVDGMTATLGAPGGIEVTFTLVHFDGHSPSPLASARVVDAVDYRAEELGLGWIAPCSCRGADALAAMAGLRSGRWPDRDELATLEGALAWPPGALKSLSAGAPAEEITEIITPAVRQELLLDSAALLLAEIHREIGGFPAQPDCERGQRISGLRRRLVAMEQTLMTSVPDCPARADLLVAAQAYHVALTGARA